MNHTDPVLQKIARYTPQDILLADVAVRIQLSPTEYEQAVSHYAVMAAWIDRPDSPLYGLVDSLYPQGGFSTGSTIAAHDDSTDYDLDAMAVIRYSRTVDPEYALATTHKAIAGEKGSRYYDKAERMTRCTQVKYDGMHLDVTSSVLVTERQPRTSIIFHSKPSDPSVPRRRLLANPHGLAEWFNARTRSDEAFGSFFERRSLDFAKMRVLAKADAVPVPDQMPAYRKSTQVICLQLIKRWRNIAYDRHYPNLRLPPSVLLTYYIGEHAGAQRGLLDELIHHVESIIAIIEAAQAYNRLVHAANPSCEEDVLTDRWPGNAREQSIFLAELRKFDAQLLKLKRGASLNEMREILEDLFGEKPARDAIAAYPQPYTNDNTTGGGFYIPGRGAIPALGAAAAPSIARAMPRSTPFGDPR